MSRRPTQAASPSHQHLNSASGGEQHLQRGQVGQGAFELGADLGGDLLGLAEGVLVVGVVVFEPGKVEVVIALGELVAGEGAEATGLAFVLALAGAAGVLAVGVDEGLEIFAGERRALAKSRGVSTTASAARSRRGDLRSRIIPIGCAAARG